MRSGNEFKSGGALILSGLVILILMGTFIVCWVAESGSDGVEIAPGGSKDSIIVLNYGEYMERDIFETFEEETGIKVYYDEAATPEEMYAKYKGGAIDYDLMCTSDYMIERLIAEGETREIDFDAMEYADNIDERYYRLSETFDPGNRYSLPYFWGTVGLLYNSAKVKEVPDSWDVIFNGDYSGDIFMTNSMRDAYMCALKYLGYSLNTENKEEIDEAQRLLLNQKKDVEAYLVDEIREEMVAGNAAVAVCYSGEAYLANEYDPDLEYAVPKEGTNLWVDSWCILNKGKNPEGALKFLDFICREDIALLNFEVVYYPTPNRALYESLPEDIREDEYVFPPEDSIVNSEVYAPLSQETTEYYGELWKELKVE
ncbi:MAG: ABC transporter substrate-binding protein [Lachnospiraceae bacterium]|nr:ABC transporter substrate-binding protein [Lachnospiraceae bacterium]